MLNKRKNNNNSNTNSRPSGPNINNMNTNRSPRVRPFSAEGVYSNAYFLHAAASHIGDVVKVQTKGGVTVDGIFKTFSPTFNIALEVAHRYQNGLDDKKINVDTVQDNLIIKPCDIVTIYAKDVDLDYATKDTFQTDTAISSRLNGTSGDRYNKELVMWDSSEVVNGDDQEVSLELDKNSNGWDANEMFKHNEKEHGVKTTYKDNLIGYTVQLEDKNSHDFKEQEIAAERIANEIENNPVYRERVDLENGDEIGDEEAFSAVIRPVSSGPPPLSNISNNHMNSNSNDKMSPTGKYVPPQKRKIAPVGKVVRHTPPPATNSMPINTQQTPQAPMKSYQPMPPQQQPMPYASQQHMPYVPPHLQQQQHTTYPGHVKINGDGMLGSKNMPPRNIRYTSAPPPVSFNEPPPSLTPVQLQQAHGMSKPSMHVAHPPHQMVTTHMVVTQDGQQTTHGGPPPHVILHPVVASPSQMPPPQPQRQPRINRDDQMPRTRDDEVNSLRKFHGDFVLGTPHVVSMQQLPPDNGSSQMHPAHHLQQSVDNSGPQMSKSQQHNNNYNNHHHQRQQQTPPLAPHQQMHTQEQIKHVHSSPPPSATTPQLQGGNIAASQNNSGSNSNSGSPNSTPSVTPSSSSLDKQPASLGGAKKYVLNPAAKPFTPRSPSTPTQSRPHTPQTPGPLAQNTFPQQQQPQQQGQHIQTQHQLMAMAYVMPNHAYQAQSNQAGHQRAMRKIPNLVAAATGAPLQHVPMHLPFHAQPPHQHYTSQPQFVRMYHENPQQQIQYLAQAPSTPSTTPSPGQHQQYHQGPQAAGQGPPTYAPSAHQYVPHIQMCPIIPGGQSQPLQLLNNFYPPGAQQPHHPPHIQVIMQQQQHPNQ